MKRAKFCQLAESYRRVDTSQPNEIKPQTDVYVEFPEDFESQPKSVSESKEESKRQVDKRIKFISDRAEREYCNRKNAEQQIMRESQLKTTVERLKTQPRIPTEPFQFSSIEQEKIFPKIVRAENVVPPTERASVDVTPTERYMQAPSYPLTRDMRLPVPPPREDSQNIKELKNYINEKKIKERYYVTSNHSKPKINFAEPSDDYSKIVLRAKLHLKNSKIELAYSTLKKAVDSGIKHADIFYMFGEVCRIKGMYQNAIKYLTESLRFELHSPYNYYSLGLTYSSLNDPSNAKKLIAHFLELVEIPEAHFELAKALSDLGQSVDALVHVSRAIELNPQSAIYYSFRGELYEQQGFLDLANSDFSRVLPLDSKFLLPYYDRYNIAVEQNNTTLAIQLQEFISKIKQHSSYLIVILLSIILLLV